jgi:drug/metabolite transporter (DMT)-like permease
MTIAFLTPIVALIVDAFWEKQVVLSLESYIGIAVVLAGVAVTVLYKINTDSKPAAVARGTRVPCESET